MQAKDRALILERIRSGEVTLLVGTHALLYVEAFHSLGLVIIDEQHKCVGALSCGEGCLSGWGRGSGRYLSFVP